MNDAGFIYAIGAEGVNGIKIGRTNKPIEHRLAQLQTGLPCVLYVIAFVRVDSGLVEIEKYLHRHLSSMRMRGEWFDIALDQRQLEDFVYAAQPYIQPRVSWSSSNDGRRTLGVAIQQARLTQRMTQCELVTQTGISQKYLSQIEHDKVDPSFSKVQRIAKALGVNLDALLLDTYGGTHP